MIVVLWKEFCTSIVGVGQNPQNILQVQRNLAVFVGPVVYW